MNSGGAADWPRLFRIAVSLIQQVDEDGPGIVHWTFGGGTALMLHIGHRESRDVDIFFADPQFLPFLDPEKRDLNFEVPPSGYDGDGSRFLKFTFNGLGEIDFISAPQLTAVPSAPMEVVGVVTLVETVTEIIAKKVFFRGASITPRDIFDIAAAAQDNRDGLIAALREFPAQVAATRAQLDRLNPDFVARSIAQLMIRPEFVALTEMALGDAKALLAAAA